MQINGDCSSCCNGTRANAPGAQHSLGEFIDFLEIKFLEVFSTKCWRGHKGGQSGFLGGNYRLDLDTID